MKLRQGKAFIIFKLQNNALILNTPHFNLMGVDAAFSFDITIAVAHAIPVLPRHEPTPGVSDIDTSPAHGRTESVFVETDHIMTQTHHISIIQSGTDPPAFIVRTHKEVISGPLVDEHLAAGGELAGRLELAHAVSLNPSGPGCG